MYKKFWNLETHFTGCYLLSILFLCVSSTQALHCLNTSNFCIDLILIIASDPLDSQLALHHTLKAAHQAGCRNGCIKMQLIPAHTSTGRQIDNCQAALLQEEHNHQQPDPIVTILFQLSSNNSQLDIDHTSEGTSMHADICVYNCSHVSETNNNKVTTL